MKFMEEKRKSGTTTKIELKTNIDHLNNVNGKRVMGIEQLRRKTEELGSHTTKKK